MRRTFLASVVAATSIGGTHAHADPPGFGFNLSGLLGLGTTHDGDRDSTGVAWGFRPEVLWRPSFASKWSYGPFAEVGSVGDAGVLFGVGGTLSIPVHGKVVLAPSAGAFTGTVFDQGFASGWTAGAFFGRRIQNDISYFDASFGLRADYHRAISGDRAGFSICIQLDLVLLVAVGSVL